MNFPLPWFCEINLNEKHCSKSSVRVFEIEVVLHLAFDKQETCIFSPYNEKKGKYLLCKAQILIYLFEEIIECRSREVKS